jgi:hypothetical protein
MPIYTRPPFAQRFPARSPVSASLCAALSAAVALLSVLLATTVFKDYTVALFCGVPVVMGFLTPLFHGMGGRRSFGSMLVVNSLSQLILFSSLLILGVEGVGCLIMCAPLWLTMALVGTSVAYPLHLALWRGYMEPRGFPVIGLLILLALPLWMGAEHLAPPTPPLIAVTSIVEIDAPPEIVWQRVISFPDLPPPHDWIFTLGAAYPLHADIQGRGIGAVRRCVFSTGTFVEPIRVWDQGKLLAFDVAQSPPSMHEVNPFWNIHPAHLDGYLLSRHGQFKLIDFGHGRTRLEGTTWYQNNMFPAAYWQLWSDAIIHRIHLRVLDQVKTLSERDMHNDATTPRSASQQSPTPVTGAPQN